jgi:hypothetical protein
VLHQLVKEQVGYGRAAQWSTGVATLGLFHGVNGKQAQCVNGQLIERVFHEAGRHLDF